MYQAKNLKPSTKIILNSNRLFSSLNKKLLITTNNRNDLLRKLESFLKIISNGQQNDHHSSSNRHENILFTQIALLTNEKCLEIFHSLIKSLIELKSYNQTYSFYESRCEYNENDLKSHLDYKFGNSFTINNTFLPYLTQSRGFKTKRQISDLNKGESETSVNSINKTFFESKSLNKELDKLLADKKIESPQQIELLGKIKSAFVEGFSYGQTVKRNTFIQNSIKFISYVIIIYLIIAMVSTINATSNGNGRNGGGINIKALTGSSNFEINPETVHVKFDDVKGLHEAKKELIEIVDFLKEPEKYTQLGARLPKGVILVGPPGCGKTLLAKSVAGEAGVPFFQASGSDFDEMFVGTGSRRVRQLFATARAKAPCVIFIDEIDSVGSTRTNSAIHPHANQTINQLLAEMDGFQKNEGIIVLGATNRKESLDSALVRPGRFDVEVKIEIPDFKARKEIIEFYLGKVAHNENIDIDFLAKKLTGLGGSSIENVVNQAALRAVVNNSKFVKMEHLEWALDRTLMGLGKSRLDDENVNKNTAYHEAGHVLVAYFTKDAHPLHKVTILPRGMSLGHTALIPENQEYSQTKSQILASLDVTMGGRVAEELIFGQDQVTTGAFSDFKSATSLANRMVKLFGMNDKIGQRVFDDKDQLSPATQELLDQEIKKILQDSYDRAKNILKTHSFELKLIAEHLLLHETLNGDQIKNLIENHKL